MLTRQRTGQFAAICDRCMAVRKSFLGPDRIEARAALLDAGWQERVRGRMVAERADWWCPGCAGSRT